MAWILNRRIWMLLLLFASCCERAQPPTHETIQLGGESWKMELAVSPGQIEQGLMNRETIPPGTGMLFIFEDSQMRSFWMGNCLSDIDLIFVDGMGRITAIHEMVTEPQKRLGETEGAYKFRMPGYSSVFPARIAIELPPGSIRQLGLKPQQSTDLDMQILESVRLRALKGTR